MQVAGTTAVALGRIALAALLETSPAARPRLSAPVATGVTAAGWLIERKKLQSRGLGREAQSAVRTKDVLVTGSVLASLAALAAREAGRHETVAASVTRAFAVAAVGATPFINFALFEDYRPHPVRSLFSL